MGFSSSSSDGVSDESGSPPHGGAMRLSSELESTNMGGPSVAADAGDSSRAAGPGCLAANPGATSMFATGLCPELLPLPLLLLLLCCTSGGTVHGTGVREVRL